MTKNELNPFIPKSVVTIVDRQNTVKLEKILREKDVHLHYMFNAMGTASSEVFKSLGLSGTEKTVCICIEPRAKALPLMTSIVDRLELTHSGNGITFIMPISGISASISNIINEELEHLSERLEKLMDTGLEEVKEGIKEESSYSLVVSVINQGFSEVLMDAARSIGIRGGTIVYARRSGIDDMVKFFGVTLQAEKEIVSIVVPRKQKKELMQAIIKKCGLNTSAHGIVISLPVENCVGIYTENEPIADPAP